MSMQLDNSYLRTYLSNTIQKLNSRQLCQQKEPRHTLFLSFLALLHSARSSSDSKPDIETMTSVTDAAGTVKQMLGF
jgi:hypothetical protein